MPVRNKFLTLRSHMQNTIVGQSNLLDRLMVGLLTGGHILLEGAPGLAKTTAVNALASGVHANFQRIQFTPDLMPGDLTGTEIFDPKEGTFRFIAGPLFHEIILADEINRAPPKVQSALLEAMQEHQVTIGGDTHALSDLFIVMATQNPLEQAGTYPLPEAQLDRFLLHVTIDYPNEDEELAILKRDQQQHFGEDKQAETSPISPETVLAARREVAEIYVDEQLERYIIAIVAATRNLKSIAPEWEDYLIAGASPRASIALLRSSSALAYLAKRDHVIPDDIIAIAPDVLRHRIIPGYAARAAKVSKDDIVQRILEQIPVP